MSTRMVGGGRTGVSPVTLIVVIILALIAGTIAFAKYTGPLKLKAEIKKVVARSNAFDRGIQAVVSETGEIRNYLDGKRDAEAVKAYFADLDMRRLVVEPRNFHKINIDLDLWLIRLDTLLSELDKRIAEAKVQAGSAEVARDNSRDDYSRQVQLKNQEFSQLDTFLRDELAKKERLVASYVKEKQEFVNKYNNTRDEWEGKKQRLLLETDQATRRNAVVRRDLRVLRPEPSLRGPSGRIVRCEWHTRKVVISLGERDDVFPGLGFEVYFIDAKGARIVKGKVEILKVLAESSVATIIESSSAHPIVAGDAIQTLFLPIPRKQKFVIAGFVPPGAIYDANQIRALIRLCGGEVQSAVDLYTDVLILGETAPSGLTDMDKKLIGAAQTEYRKGRSEAEKARELSVDVLDYREFLENIRR